MSFTDDELERKSGNKREERFAKLMFCLKILLWDELWQPCNKGQLGIYRENTERRCCVAPCTRLASIPAGNSSVVLRRINNVYEEKTVFICVLSFICIGIVNSRACRLCLLCAEYNGAVVIVQYVCVRKIIFGLLALQSRKRFIEFEFLKLFWKVFTCARSYVNWKSSAFVFTHLQRIKP
jgi:hypothetical protein